MTSDQLREAAVLLYGKHGWQARLAEALHVDISTVWRWAHGMIPVPGPVEAAVNCFLDRKQQ